MNHLVIGADGRVENYIVLGVGEPAPPNHYPYDGPWGIGWAWDGTQPVDPDSKSPIGEATLRFRSKKGPNVIAS